MVRALDSRIVDGFDYWSFYFQVTRYLGQVVHTQNENPLSCQPSTIPNILLCICLCRATVQPVYGSY